MHDGSTAAVASTATNEGYSLLHNVVVKESLRGIGLGEKLCRATIEKSKEFGAKYSYLQVMQENKTASRQTIIKKRLPERREKRESLCSFRTSPHTT